MSHEHSEYIKHSEKVHVFYIGFDLLDDGIGQVEDKFNEELFNDIPAFAFGTDVVINKQNEIGIVPTVREAMRKIYDIPEIREAQREYLDSSTTQDKYITRGEFGELLLYHLLHEYFNADALISKIYFKDSANIPAHGFDAVHVDIQNEILWLGESKLYQNGTLAIDALIKDLHEHFNTKFFDSEFQIITNRLHDTNTEHPEWIKELINPNTKNLSKLAKINIALFAAFDSETVKNYDEEEFLTRIQKEVIKLKERANKKFSQHSWHDKLNIYLFLFPLKDKRDFVSKLHIKLKGAQQI